MIPENAGTSVARRSVTHARARAVPVGRLPGLERKWDLGARRPGVGRRVAEGPEPSVSGPTQAGADMVIWKTSPRRRGAAMRAAGQTARNNYGPRTDCRDLDAREIISYKVKPQNLASAPVGCQGAAKVCATAHPASALRGWSQAQGGP